MTDVFLLTWPCLAFDECVHSDQCFVRGGRSTLWTVMMSTLWFVFAARTTYSEAHRRSANSACRPVRKKHQCIIAIMDIATFDDFVLLSISTFSSSILTVEGEINCSYLLKWVHSSKMLAKEFLTMR